ncbi:MAG: PAS domain-containing sensor histidine kinase [Micavibrio sp.]|nr:MAG: PAS domain-containing sensor histidine kinase [Micavibrio sp.]
MAEQQSAEREKGVTDARRVFAQSSKKSGYNDVTGFCIRNIAIVLALFAVTYLVAHDLKRSEGQKISDGILQTAQNNIRHMETAGAALLDYLQKSGGAPERDEVVFFWDMLEKSGFAQAMLWFSPPGQHWRRMDIYSEYNMVEVMPDEGTPAFNASLQEKLQGVGSTTALLEPESVAPLLPASMVFQEHGDREKMLPWIFVRENAGAASRSYLVLLPNPAEIFAVRSEEGNIAAIRELKILRPHDRYEIFSYLNGNPAAAMFQPVVVTQGLRVGGEVWEAKVTAVPTTAYMVFTVLPWAVLSLGMVWAGAGGVMLYKTSLKERQLAHISETLSNKNTELLNREAERQKMINAFQKSEWEYRSIINAVSDVIFETDHEGKIQFLNETWRNLVRSDTESAMGQNLFDYLHDGDAAHHRELFHEFLDGNRSAYRREARLKTENGDYRFIELGFSMIRLADQGSRVVGTITDIEQRKKAELAHDNAQRRYREMFENALNGIYQASGEGGFISVNQAMADTLGYDSPEDLKEQITNISEQLYVDPHQRKMLEVQVTQHGKVFGIENEMYKKDGTKIWALESLRAVYGEDKEVLYYEGNIWDVTTRREADDALKTAKMQAELTSRARIEFMANMSHELRTPLNAVIGFSEIIRNEVMGPIQQEAYKEYAQDIHNSGKQLLNIINDILELSQIEIGDRELKEKSFPMERVVKSVLSLLDHKIKEGHLRVAVNVPEDLPHIFAEELAMKQTLMNVVSNCVKFTPEGGKIEISASVDEEGHMVLDISDTGVGMTEEELAKAMQPFGQVATDLDRENSGTGLGLSIVQALVELHKGRLLVQSRKGEGTNVKIVFPQQRVVPRPRNHDAEAAEASAAEAESADVSENPRSAGQV